ncbi:uncharacterized protein LOC62_01G000322 [Vanrija pseudolonga]|uniref:Uncharacterized protein n=1 Tax=Vanrija pseudolonga TaxID=143232 RepID=A0AAF0Y248_9TREE|nr:hypothetical protein LOC62_01G000322 [Vanrija pseudolonga]
MGEYTVLGPCTGPAENNTRTLLLALRPCSAEDAVDQFDAQGIREMGRDVLALATHNLAQANIRFATSAHMIRFGAAEVGFSSFPAHPWPGELDDVQSRAWDLLAVVSNSGLTVDLDSLREITTRASEDIGDMDDDEGGNDTIAAAEGADNA